MHRLVNVPHKNSKSEIRAVVEGNQITIIAADPGSTWRDGHSVMMTDEYIGDHMLAKPQELRELVGRSLAIAIEMARDIGYAQAMADVRGLIGAKAEVHIR